MKFHVHGGKNEIGGNCIEIISKGKSIILDIGIPVEANKPHEDYMPNINGLYEKDPNLLGIFVSHSHIDHFGLIKYLKQGIPLGMGRDSKEIINISSNFIYNKIIINKVKWEFESGKEIKIGPFKITPYIVDHSAYDAYSFMVKADGETLFYTGDFRFHGRKSYCTKEVFSSLKDKVNYLIIEGTNLDKTSNISVKSEVDVQKDIEKILIDFNNPVLIQFSSQNIDRIVSIFKACQKTGKNFIIDLYTAEILNKISNKNIPKIHWNNMKLYIPQYQRIIAKNNSLFDLVKIKNRIYPENLKEYEKNSVFFVRDSYINEIRDNISLDNSIYIYSLWDGYWEMNRFNKIKKTLKDYNIPKLNIHCSGHVYQKDISNLITKLSPKETIFVHTNAKSDL